MYASRYSHGLSRLVFVVHVGIFSLFDEVSSIFSQLVLSGLRAKYMTCAYLAYMTCFLAVPALNIGGHLALFTA